MFLSWIFVIGLFVSSIQPMEYTNGCSFWQKYLLTMSCGTGLENFTDGINSNMFRRDYQYMIRLCKSVLECLSSHDCAKFDRMKIEETCEFINYLETENQSCLKGFFKTIYNLPLTGNASCYGDFSFVDKDLKNREKAYIDGKECFMEYIQNNCNNTTLQYFNSENYKKFIRSASSDPSEFDCEDPVHGVEMIRCSTASAELDRFKILSDDIENRLNRTFVTTILRTCRDVVGCGTNRCLFYKSDCERIELSKKCDMIEKEYL